MEVVRSTKHDEVLLLGYAVRPQVYAKLLAALLNGARAYIAVLAWQRRIGPWREKHRAVCGSETRLVSGTLDTAPVLEVPDWEHLRQIRLTVFYEDDSVLTVGLGAGDRAIIVKPGSGEARKRVQSVEQILAKRGWHPDSISFGGLVAVLVLTVIALLLADADTAAGVVTGTSLFLAFIFLSVTTGNGLRPRPSRVGASWAAMGWGREDLRRLITAIIASGIVLAIGVWIGHK